MNRRHFIHLSAAGAAGVALSRAGALRAEEAAPALPAAAKTGSGRFTFESVPGWGATHPGVAGGPTHGDILNDKAGNILVSTDGPGGILVYRPDGAFVESLAPKFTAIHSMQIVEENGVEFIYAAWLGGRRVLKLNRKTGEAVLNIAAPAEVGNWAPTGVIAAFGKIFVADGYGSSKIFVFDKDGNYKSFFGGGGSADGKFRTCHGLELDTRGKDPLLLVIDRENHRLSYFDLDGKFVRHIAKGLRRPCQVSLHGDCIAVSELQGRAVILDKDGAIASKLGDNPNKGQWANYGVPPKDFQEAVFNAPHGIHWDPSGDIYVGEWNSTGRFSKLVSKPA